MLRLPISISLLLLGIAANACAQLPAGSDYPAHALRFILPFPPGGGTDLLGRLLAQALSERVGQPVVAENRPGAGGNIGNEAAARAAPDGYTLLLGSPGLAISPSLYRKLGYDALRDLQPVSLVAEIPNVLTVHRNVPARSVKELVQLARSQPGKLAFGTGGAGTSNELGAQLFLTATRLRILIVPHKGVNQATLALIGGHVDMVIAGVATVAPHIREQKLRGLALLGTARSPVLPEVPTAAEAGYSWLQVQTWYVVMVPAGTPSAIVERLHAVFAAIHGSEAVRSRVVKLGFAPLVSSPQQAAQFLALETERWAKVVAAAGVRVE
jgi:tripartite-type tricarboxylate transporter receptor subunit TctC